MSELYTLAKNVTAQLEARHSGDAIGLVRAKGELAAKTGFLVTLISRSDADDPDRVRRLRAAAADMGIPL